MRTTSQLKIGAVLTYISIGFTIIVGAFYTPWMIEQIGKSDYGLYTLANSIISLFLVDFGLSSATSRFVAKYRAEKREQEIPGFIGMVYKLYLIIDAVVLAALLIMYLCLDRLYVNLLPAELCKLKVVFCMAGCYSVISFPCVTFNGILNAYEKFAPLKFADFVQRIGTVVLTSLALLMGYKLYALVVVHAISGLISIAIKAVYVSRCTTVRFVRSDYTQIKEVFRFSLWSFVYALAQRLIFNITPTILGVSVAAASSAIAVFGIITTIEGYAFTITTAISGMFLSRVTHIIQDDEEGKKITDLAIQVGRFQFALNGLILVGFFLVGKEFINLWVGPDYQDAYLGIVLIIFPQVFYNALQIANTTILARNLIRYQAYVQIIMGLCNVVLSVVLSRIWGAIGASVSICIAYSLRTILTLVLVKRKINFDLGRFAKQCFMKMSIPLGVAMLICWPILKQMSSGGWVALALKILIVVLVQLVSVIVLGLSNDEKKCLLRRISIHK